MLDVEKTEKLVTDVLDPAYQKNSNQVRKVKARSIVTAF